MSSYLGSGFRNSFRCLLASFLQGGGLSFARVLDEQEIDQAFAEERVSFANDEDDVYTPAVTLWAFLWQALCGDGSCRAAVARVVVVYAALGRPISANTGAYCRARAKLPETVLRRLAIGTGRRLQSEVPPQWRWKGRTVQLIDGTTLTMADTPDNQKLYPQPSSQAPGLGFPILRLLVVFCLASGAMVDAAFGPYTGKQTGETALLRRLLASFEPGQVLLADRYFCSYFLIALAIAAGIDVVFRQHQRRHTDFRRGQRLGKHDHLVTWERPARPEWMDEETYARMPARLTLREVQVQVRTPGFRVRTLTVVTTLCRVAEYTKDDIADLYHQRWHAELDIEALKVTLGMDQLRCKTPPMVHRELWAHLLGYNLIRKAAAQAALEAGRRPRSISFKGTMQTLFAACHSLTTLTEAPWLFLAQALLGAMAEHVVGNRPNRCEPRGVKRRLKKYPHLHQPRAELQAQLKHAAA